MFSLLVQCHSRAKSSFIWSLCVLFVRKILMSVKFLSAILGPEMGASILWTPGKTRSFCKKTHVHKIPRFRGGVFWVFFGGGSDDFIFMGARIFLTFLYVAECTKIAHRHSLAIFIADSGIAGIPAVGIVLIAEKVAIR